MINKKLNILSKKIRLEIIEQTFLKKSGHLGGALSCVDILVNIYYNLILKKPQHKFILSKGHCALALYSVLFSAKKISKKKFLTFAKEGSVYGEHSSPKIKNKYICFSTGSLGHGLGFGSGIAYANHLNQKQNKTFVLMSDGEMNSGSVWEAALLSSKLNLVNLIGIIDYNKFQATGRSDEILNIKPLEKKWESFGWNVFECNGNDHRSLKLSISKAMKSKSQPSIIIAHTIKGKGVSFMEDDNNWHYRAPNKLEVEKSKIELGL